MNDRKVHLDKASREIEEAALLPPVPAQLKIMSTYLESALENYLNAMDRLCFCIQKKYLEEKDWRAEYRNVLHNTIGTYKQQFLEGSPFQNIIAVNRLWQSQ